LKKQLNPLPMNQEWFFLIHVRLRSAALQQLYNVTNGSAIGGIATNQLVTPHFIKEVVDQDGLVVVPNVLSDRLFILG